MRMSRIKLSWVLPPLMVALAEGSFWVARHPHPPMRGDPYWHSTFELICLGLNTPVDRAAIIIYGLSVSWIGVFSGDLIYMVLTALLWYLVGKKIDSYRQPKVDAQEGISVGRVLGNSLSILYGLYLLLAISFHNVIFTNPRDGNGGSSDYYADLIRQVLWFLRSLILIFIPGITIARSLRHQRLASLDP
jgi:hypothetical protein